jgi:hypothetical protein
LGPEGRRFESRHPDKRKSLPAKAGGLFFAQLRLLAIVSNSKNKALRMSEANERLFRLNNPQAGITAGNPGLSNTSCCLCDGFDKHPDIAFPDNHDPERMSEANERLFRLNNPQTGITEVILHYDLKMRDL